MINYTYTKKYNGEQITSDPNLTKEEKEFHIQVIPYKKICIISTDKKAALTKLIKMSEVKDDVIITQLRKYEGCIVGGEFEINMGYLSISSKPRSFNCCSTIFSTTFKVNK